MLAGVLGDSALGRAGEGAIGEAGGGELGGLAGGGAGEGAAGEITGWISSWKSSPRAGAECSCWLNLPLPLRVLAMIARDTKGSIEKQLVKYLFLIFDWR